MRARTASVTFLGLGVLVASAVLPSCQPEKGSASKVVPSTAPTNEVEKRKDRELAMIADYRSWHRVNPEPITMTDVVAKMCRLLTKKEAEEFRSVDPHIAVQEQKSFTVYVNEVGKDRLLGKAAGTFPVGTCIVKVKHDGQDATTSELLTVMIKREAGFAPQIGDWDFLVLDGFAKSVQGRGAMKNCVSCHTAVNDNDFVYASYVEGRESVATKHFTTPFAADKP